MVLGIYDLGRMVVAAVVLLGLWTLVRLIRRARTPGLSPAARSARRRAAVASAMAGVAAVAVVIVLETVPFAEPERVTAAAPALVGAAMIIVAIVAERRWPRPSGHVRTATLRTTHRGSSSRALSWMAVVSGVGSVALLIIARLTEAPGGRALIYSWDSGFFPGDTGSLQSGPYPGSHYTWVVLGGLALVGALTVIGLRVVDSRPALGAGLTQEDEAAREGSRVRVLRGSAFANLAITAGLLLAMAYSWMGIVGKASQGPVPPLIDGVGWSDVNDFSFIPVLASLAIAVLAVKVFLTPGPSMPAAQERQSRRGDATVGAPTVGRAQ